MNINTKEMYSEVYGVLDMLGENYISKLPSSLYNMIKEEKLETYNPNYDATISLDKQNLKRETLSMIALFHLNYWCDSEEEKNKLKELFKSNEEKHQLEIREKYNPDNIFKKHNQVKEIKDNIVKNENSLVEYKETFFTRFINKIKNIFHIN